MNDELSRCVFLALCRHGEVELAKSVAPEGDADLGVRAIAEVAFGPAGPVEFLAWLQEKYRPEWSRDFTPAGVRILRNLYQEHHDSALRWFIAQYGLGPEEGRALQSMWFSFGTDGERERQRRVLSWFE